jgi:hypothetical protein
MPQGHRLGNSLQVEDEIYQISDFDYRGSRVLLRLDPSSVDLSKTGVHQRFYGWPLAWTRLYGDGRVFYTALDHLAGRPLPANPHERYPLVYATVALADAVALRICATPGSWCPRQRFGPSWSATSAPGQEQTFSPALPCPRSAVLLKRTFPSPATKSALGQ